MADKRISDLTAATTLASADQFVLVQSGVTKNITAGVLQNTLSTIEDYESITTGAISVSTDNTFLTSNTSSYTLAAANAAGPAVKTIIIGTWTAGTSVVTVTNAGWKSSGTGTITFAANANTLGQSVVLKYVNSKWHVIGVSSLTGTAIAFA